jgi:hypothetical protein
LAAREKLSTERQRELKVKEKYGSELFSATLASANPLTVLILSA